MWKPRPEDNKPMSMNPTQPAQPVPPPVAAAAPSIPTPQKETPKASDPHRADVGHIGKSVQIKGELTGSEDLYLDGSIEGTVDLRDHSLIIGPNGKIKAALLRGISSSMAGLKAMLLLPDAWSCASLAR